MSIQRWVPTVKLAERTPIGGPEKLLLVGLSRAASLAPAFLPVILSHYVMHRCLCVIGGTTLLKWSNLSVVPSGTTWEAQIGGGCCEFQASLGLCTHHSPHSLRHDMTLDKSLVCWYSGLPPPSPPPLHSHPALEVLCFLIGNQKGGTPSSQS